MSQSISFSDLGGLLGLSGTGSDPASLQQVFDTLGVEGKTFADLLDSEFTQLLDPELLEQGLEDLNPDVGDNLLPLLALLGGNFLPPKGEDAEGLPLTLQSDGGKKALQDALKAIESRLADRSADLETGKPVLVSSADEGEDISDEFLKQLQLSSTKVLQASPPTGSQSSAQLGPLQLNGSQPLMTSQQLSPVAANQTVQTPPGQPGWDVAVGQRLIWMVGNEIKSAEIKLNPAELGPMEVKVRTEGDKVQISFHVQNAPVREAIEQSIPRLREAFSGQGMDLLNVNVSQQGFSQHEQHGEHSSAHEGFPGTGGEGIEAGEISDVKVTSTEGLVDYYI